MNILPRLVRALAFTPKAILSLCALGSLITLPAADAAISITFTYDANAGTILIASAGSAPTSTTGGGAANPDVRNVFHGGIVVGVGVTICSTDYYDVEWDGPWVSGVPLSIYSVSIGSEMTGDVYTYDFEASGLTTSTSTGEDLTMFYITDGFESPPASEILVKYDAGTDSLSAWMDGTITLTEISEGSLAAFWGDLTEAIGDGVYLATASDAEHLLDITLVSENVPEPRTYAAIFGGVCLLVLGFRRLRSGRRGR
jgi:hypothetical protein